MTGIVYPTTSNGDKKSLKNIDLGNQPGLSRDCLSLALANRALTLAGQFWFLVAVAGQWVFAYYITSLYVSSALQGNFEAWNKAMAHGYSSGDIVGNLFLGAHLFAAAIITFGGAMQLVPQIRSRAAAFHRWNGRLYIATAFIISIAGLYLSWAPRNQVGGTLNGIAISLNALLIMLSAAMALRYAAARNFSVHRRWALRLFVVVSGVWFFRVGFMLWMFINGPVGHTKMFDGPFDVAWFFGSYLLPLAILEIYFYVQNRAKTAGRIVMASGLFLITIGMGAGIILATAGMWLPRL